jgi:hypothetical protein
VTNIGARAFQGCKRLAVINLPDSVEEIGEDAFDETAWQNNILVIEDGVVIDGKRYKGTPVIPEGVTEIGEYAFYLYTVGEEVSEIYHVVIPDTVTLIDDYAFHDCPLYDLDLPDSVKYIGKRAFEHCFLLQELTIPANVAAIGDYAFYNCGSLRRVVISEGAPAIGAKAFAKCEALSEVFIPESVTYIAGNAFENDEKLTIKGIAGSYAEQFAKEHSIPFVAIKEIPAITTTVTTETTTETTTTTTTTQLIPLNNRNAFITIQAESADVLEGIEVAEQSDEVTCIGYIENGDYVIYKDIDFADGAVKFMIMASGADEGTVEVHLDSPEGALLGSVTCEPTGDWLEYRQFETAITPTDGIHDLCLLFKGDGEYVMNVDSFVFAKAADGILYGDVNQDKSVSVADAVLLCKYISELEGTVISDAGLTASDMDQDGLLTIMDVSRILILLELSALID